MYYKIKYQGVAFVECENEEQAQELFDNKEYFMNTIICEECGWEWSSKYE